MALLCVLLLGLLILLDLLGLGHLMLVLHRQLQSLSQFWVQVRVNSPVLRVGQPSLRLYLHLSISFPISREMLEVLIYALSGLQVQEERVFVLLHVAAEDLQLLQVLFVLLAKIDHIHSDLIPPQTLCEAKFKLKPTSPAQPRRPLSGSPRIQQFAASASCSVCASMPAAPAE